MIVNANRGWILIDRMLFDENGAIKKVHVLYDREDSIFQLVNPIIWGRKHKRYRKARFTLGNTVTISLGRKKVDTK